MAMSVGHWVAGSCAAMAISNLGMQGNAPNAMKEFCKSELLVGGNSRFGYTSVGKYQKFVAAHYIFIAGPEVPGKGHSKTWVKYGTEFAAYIKDHKLGKTVTLPKVVNDKYHPDTDCQVWLWQPDYDGLVKWWESVGSKL